MIDAGWRGPWGSASFVVDSGTQRTDAHRFYPRKRMKISCFHFERPLLP